MDIVKISKLEAICLIVVIMTNKIILNIPKEILKTTSSSAWINVIYISIIAIAFIFFTCKLFKNFQNYDIIDISNYLGGKWLKTCIGILYFIAPFIVAFAILGNFSLNLKIIYYTTSPLIYIFLFFIIGAIIANKMGLKAILKSNLIITPILLFSIVIVFASTTKYFVPQRLLPILRKWNK